MEIGTGRTNLRHVLIFDVLADFADIILARVNDVTVAPSPCVIKVSVVGFQPGDVCRHGHIHWKKIDNTWAEWAVLVRFWSECQWASGLVEKQVAPLNQGK